MESLTSKMRSLAIESLKNRREAIFQRTRNLIEMRDTQQEHEQESVCSEENGDDFEDEQKEQMEIEQLKPKRNTKKKKNKHTNNDFKTKRYWRRLLQVSDWMSSVPQNLNQFFVAARGQGSKCLMIMKYNTIDICDKSGSQLAQFSCPSKLYNGTVLQIYFDAEQKTIVVSDLIVWKSNPMTGSQFDFRYAWFISNLNIKTLQQFSQYKFHFMQYYPCTIEHLRVVYEGQSPYQRQGLIFVHKDSPYLHGHNPNVLIWKDTHVSKYFEPEMVDNKFNSRGIGYINKDGDVRTLQNAHLFRLDRQVIGPVPKFAKFNFTQIELKESNGEQVSVHLKGLQLIQTCKHHHSPVDSLGKLLHKSTLKYGSIKFQQLVSTLSPKMMAQ